MNQKLAFFIVCLAVTNFFCSKPQILINSENNTRESHRDIVIKVKFSPDGDLLASGGNDSDIMLWDGKNGKYLRTLPGEYDKIFDIAFLDAGKKITTANYSGSIIVWDLKKGIQEAIKLDSDFISSFDFAFPENIFFTASWDKSVKVLEINSKKVMRECKNRDYQIRTVKYSEKNKLIYAGTSRGYLLRIAPGNCEISNGEEKKMSDSAITSLDLNDELSLLAIAFNDGKLILYDLESLKEIANLQGHKSSVNAVKINQIYNKIISGDKDGKIFVWDMKTRENMNFAGHIDSVNSIDISPDGKRMASGSSDHIVKVWSMDKILFTKKN
ncbi:MAG: WD40 repeat domain-containing protein [Spirochaetia bacterium]|nr:WD40 repeat domain-containing protein [Spirochaetia bacterium]